MGMQLMLFKEIIFKEKISCRVIKIVLNSQPISIGTLSFCEIGPIAQLVRAPDS